MTSKSLPWTSSLLLAFVVLLPVDPASAVTTGRPTGLSVSVDSITGPTVDFTVRMTTTGTDTQFGTIGSPVGFLGDLWSFQYTFFGPTVTNRYRIVTPDINALDFGDGSTVGDTALSMVTPGPPNVFTGSFSHTYPAAGSYTMTANVWRGVAGFTTSAPAPSPGTPITIDTPTYYRRLSYFLPTFPSPYSYTGYPVAPLAIGVSNSATVNLTAVAIPTATEAVLMLLAVLLAAAGVAVLRR